MRILHVIEKLTPGGPTRAVTALAKFSARQGDGRHAVATLLPPYAPAVAQAEAVGLEVAQPKDDEELDRLIAVADIVQVHFWNSPRLYQALDRDWPAARVVCWCHVAGDRPAQIVTPSLMAFPDVMLATAAETAALPVFRGAPAGVETGTIPAAADFDRIDGATRRIHGRFTVGYIGLVDFMKMHPDFAAMHAAIRVPKLRVMVCGSGADLPGLIREAGRLGCAERFDFRGEVESVGQALAELDVFGYPLSPETWATAELALQEAMYAGVPPVVLAGGAPARLVRSEETGLVVAETRDYPRAVERLHREPGLRAELGAAAARFARETFGADKMARSFNTVYEKLLARPKRARRLGGPSPARSGAARFVASLGDGGEPFAVSLGANHEDPPRSAILAAEGRIAAAPPLLANGAAGGILHYRLHYPSDPHLRFWAGLVLEQQGRAALAAMEFRQAIALGLDHSRVRERLETVSRRRPT